MESGAVGLSSGLIYAPGMHADAEELRAVATAAARRGGLYASHMRNEADGLFEALDEAVSTIRAAADAGVDRPRLQVSHLKCASRAVHGRAADAIGVLEAARSDGLDVGADQYPYTAAATTLTTILPPALLGLGMEACVAALSDPDVRGRVKAEIERGISGWENIGRDPGWTGIRISYSASHPDWSGRSLADLADEFGADPADLAFDALVDDRLDVSIVIDCMTPRRCRDHPRRALDRRVHGRVEGRRPGHPVLDVGRPHPRTYGTTARVLGTYVRERGTLALETAVEKLTSVPAAQIGLRDRGVLREGAYADLVVFDPTTVADVATYERSGAPPGRDRARGRERSSRHHGRSRNRRAAGSTPAAGRVTRPGRGGADGGAGHRGPARRPAALHASPLAAGAQRSGRDPPGSRGRRHASGDAVGDARRRAPCDRVPRRAGGVAPASPRSAGAGRRDTRVAGWSEATEAWSRSAVGCTGSASFRRCPGSAGRTSSGSTTSSLSTASPRTGELTPAILEAWLRHQARGDDRGRRSPCTRLRSTSDRPASPCATRGPAGGVPRDRAGCRSRGASSSRPPRPSRRSSATSWPISASSGTARGSGPWSRRAAPIIGSGAAGSTITRRSSTEPWRPTSSGVPAPDRR